MIKIKQLSMMIPIIVLLLLSVVLWRSLSFDSAELPAALIGQEGPKFRVTTLEDPHTWVDESILKDKVSVINVWASWCLSCRKEHDIWNDIQKELPVNFIQLVGLNYHDTLAESLAWLKSAGNPYQFNFFDEKGRLGIEFGVYGTPETYVVDKNGIIQFRHIGPINLSIWATKILPLINELSSLTHE